MGFLARSRDRLLLPRKVARWQKEPSPTALCDVVQTLLRLDEIAKAWTIAREGYARFKEHELVREVWRSAGRAHAEQGLELARAELRTRPSAAAYLRLARFSVLLRDGASAMTALEECLRRFPTAAAAHAALAELLEQRWLRDLAAADGRAVLLHLRKAWRLDGADGARPLRLASFLARAGAPRAALEVVDELLQLHATNAAARTLRASLVQRIAVVAAHPARDADGAVGRSDSEPVDDSDQAEDVDALLRQIEESGRLDGDAGDAARVARESERLRAFLPALRQRTGCEKALVVEPKGQAWDESGALGAGPLTLLAANLARSAQFTARRSDLGRLASVALETTGGALLIERAQRCSVAVLLDQPEEVARARRGLEELVAGKLHAAPIGPPVRSQRSRPPVEGMRR